MHRLVHRASCKPYGYAQSPVEPLSNADAEKTLHMQTSATHPEQARRLENMHAQSRNQSRFFREEPKKTHHITRHAMSITFVAMESHNAEGGVLSVKCFVGIIVVVCALHHKQGWRLVDG